MARFFFDVHESGLIAEDREGSELADAAAAHREAAAALGEILLDTLRKSQEPRGIRMVVRDETGNEVWDMVVFFATHNPREGRVRN